MKILFDVREGSRNITGIGTYVRNLAREIRAHQDPGIVCKCIPESVAPPPGKGVSSLPLQAVNFLRNMTWKQVWLPAVALREKADMLLCMDPIGPLACPTRLGLILYDLIFLTTGAQSDAWTRYWRAMVPRCARKADLILTLSQASKAEITARLGVPPEKIVVFHTGVSDHFRPPAGDEAERKMLRRAQGLPESYVLTVGAHDPRRNVKTLLAAFRGLRARGAFPQKLVVVGPKTPFFPEVLRAARSLGLEHEVLFLDYVPNESLPSYYGLADLYVYPSSEEGFGLTPLEAMACGCPVVTSRTSSLPEVVGDAAVLVDPTDAGELEAAMSRVLTDRELRRSLIGKGARRAKECSWRSGAEDILEACRRRIAGGAAGVGRG